MAGTHSHARTSVHSPFHAGWLEADRDSKATPRPRERELTDLTKVMEKVSGTAIVCCPRSPSCSEEELARSLH